MVTLENNNATVLQVVEGTSNFHITELTLTGTDQDTGDIVFSDTLPVGQGNRTGLQDELTTCTTPLGTFVDEETGHTIEVVASAEGFFTPRGALAASSWCAAPAGRGLAAPVLLLASIRPSA